MPCTDACFVHFTGFVSEATSEVASDARGLPRDREEEEALEAELKHDMSDVETKPFSKDFDLSSFGYQAPVGLETSSITLEDKDTSSEQLESSASGQPAHAGESKGEEGDDNEPIVFRERWSEKEARIRASSPYAHLRGWRLMPIIVKSRDDLRQEMVVSQLLKQFALIWGAAGIPAWIRPYDIIATSETCGLLEAIPDTISIDALRRADPTNAATLNRFFERHFGSQGSVEVGARACSMAMHWCMCLLPWWRV